jgi:hypothetical protein
MIIANKLLIAVGNTYDAFSAEYTFLYHAILYRWHHNNDIDFKLYIYIQYNDYCLFSGNYF